MKFFYIKNKLFIKLFFYLVLILTIFFVCYRKINIRVLSVTKNETKRSFNSQIGINTDINNDEFWRNEENLGIGLFWTNKIEVYENENISKNRDLNIQLYVTNDGKNFTYISETGISGRDPNIICKNGVFYVVTTPDADTERKSNF